MDCYAEWCKPCKKIEPILREKIESLEGKVRMVKLNIDDYPQLSTGLNIRSIPAVFLIYKGNIVDTFSGVPETKLIDEFFNTALLLNEMQTDEGIMDNVMTQIEEMVAAKQYESAIKVINDSLTMDKWKEKYGTQMHIVKAYC